MVPTIGTINHIDVMKSNVAKSDLTAEPESKFPQAQVIEPTVSTMVSVTEATSPNPDIIELPRVELDFSSTTQTAEPELSTAVCYSKNQSTKYLMFPNIRLSYHSWVRRRASSRPSPNHFRSNLLDPPPNITTYLRSRLSSRKIPR